MQEQEVRPANERRKIRQLEGLLEDAQCGQIERAAHHRWVSVRRHQNDLATRAQTLDLRQHVQTAYVGQAVIEDSDINWPRRVRRGLKGRLAVTGFTHVAAISSERLGHTIASKAHVDNENARSGGVRLQKMADLPGQ